MEPGFFRAIFKSDEDFSNFLLKAFVPPLCFLYWILYLVIYFPQLFIIVKSVEYFNEHGYIIPISVAILLAVNFYFIIPKMNGKLFLFNKRLYKYIIIPIVYWFMHPTQSYGIFLDFILIYLPVFLYNHTKKIISKLVRSN